MEKLLPQYFLMMVTQLNSMEESAYNAMFRGGFRGGGGRTPPPSPQGFDPLPTQRVPPLILFQKSIFGGSTLKFFKKGPKTAFFTVFSKICLRRRKFCQNRGKTVLWESSKNQFGRPQKKKVVKILENFSKIRPPPPPPLEKILDPPLAMFIKFYFL